MVLELLFSLLVLFCPLYTVFRIAPLGKMVSEREESRGVITSRKATVLNLLAFKVFLVLLCHLSAVCSTFFAMRLAVRIATGSVLGLKLEMQ